MTNGIDKKALFKLKSETYLRPISDLGVGFYNLDENTAILRFQLSNEKGPLLVHENNLTAYAYFESSNGSVSDVIELEIEDSFNGIVTITLDKEFLQASTSTKVKGQVYIGVNNVDGKPEYNEVAVFREFTFEVADALINKISSFTKVEYIRMFSQLKMKIEQQVKDIEEAIANGADYVAEMKAVLQEGIETLNAIVADGKTDIQAFINQAKSDLDNTKDSAVNDITTTSNNAKTSVTETADGVIKNINNVSGEVTKHVDDKLIEFNGLLETEGFLTPEELGNQLSELEWQKYKLTNDDGTRKYLDKGSFTDVTALPTGFYETPTTQNAIAQGFPPGIGNEYTVLIDIIKGTSGRTQIKVVQNSNFKTFVKLIDANGVDRGWKEMFIQQTDTGWIPYSTINGVGKNVVYKNSGDNGFDCGYRIIKDGNVTRKILRVNVNNLTQGVIFAELPNQFSKNTQTFLVRTPRDKNSAIVEVKADGKLIFQYYSNTTDWTDTDYIYGEFTWHD